MTTVDLVVVGAGIHGLCAARALRHRGRDVIVLDREPAGHERGGSHGKARITRSSYHDRRYVEMARAMHERAWPQLETELGTRLVVGTPGVFFGPANGPIRTFVDATLAACGDVEEIAVADAARQFPLLRFETDERVLLDHTAGVIAADRTLQGLRAWLLAHDVTICDGVATAALRPEADAVVVVTRGEELRARHVVVATGAWLGELVPEWRAHLTPLRQEVGYVDVDAAPSALEVGTFPVWCRIADEFDYGLPEFGRPGLKLALHRTVGPNDDLDNAPPAIDEVALLARARRRLAVSVLGLHGSEPCLYAVAPGEHLRVARSAADPRIVAIAACSGHGFKFGPVLAEQVAAMVCA